MRETEKRDFVSERVRKEIEGDNVWSSIRLRGLQSVRVRARSCVCVCVREESIFGMDTCALLTCASVGVCMLVCLHVHMCRRRCECGCRWVGGYGDICALPNSQGENSVVAHHEGQHGQGQSAHPSTDQPPRVLRLDVLFVRGEGCVCVCVCAQERERRGKTAI